MQEPNFGVIVNRLGEVHFHPDLAPAHKRTMIGMLVELGHTLEHASDGSKITLLTGPRSAAEQAKQRAAASKPL